MYAVRKGKQQNGGWTTTTRMESAFGGLTEVRLFSRMWRCKTWDTHKYIIVNVILWLFNIAMGNGPFIDGLPINSMVIFHGYVSHNQRVYSKKRLDQKQASPWVLTLSKTRQIWRIK